MGNSNDTTPQAVVACHDLLEWVIPRLDKFPRARRFTLGERIETGLLFVLGRIERSDVCASVAAWIGHTRHAQSMGLRTAVLDSVCFKRETGRTMRPACATRRRLEQQTEEPPFREPQ